MYAIRSYYGIFSPFAGDKWRVDGMTSQQGTTGVPLEMSMDIREILHFLGDIYEHRMPFDRLLGIRIAVLTLEEVKVQIDMREELVGNYIRGILHGGVISSVLDLTGGLIASVELIKLV